jgi:phage recombination protein Bet
MTENAVVLSEGSRQMLDGLNVVRATLAPDLTDGELQLFALVASRSGLDPFARQIHAQKRAGKMVIMTGIDGYRSIAARTGEYDGQDEPVYGPDCPCSLPAHPEWATVAVYRKGMGRPVKATAYWHEYVPQQDFMWKRMPHVMIAKVAEALALRKCFPWDPTRGIGIGSDVYTTEEMEQADRPPAVTVSVQERVMAKAGAIDGYLSLREFADAVSDVEPATITAIRDEMFPGIGGVKNLTGVQLLALRDRLLETPETAETFDMAPGSATIIDVPAVVISDAARAEYVNVEEIAEGGHAVKRCRAVAPISGEQCSLGTGHRGIHRATDAEGFEGWPRKADEATE